MKLKTKAAKATAGRSDGLQESERRKNVVWDDGEFGPHHGYHATGEVALPTKTPNIGTTAVMPNPQKQWRGRHPVDVAIEVLNRALTEDRNAINAMFNASFPCSQGLADDETIQVIGGEQPCVRMLGIINGLFGIDERGFGHIAAVVEEDLKTIVRFEWSHNHATESHVPDERIPT